MQCVGDAAIENALALADGNLVTIVNRGSKFPRAKPANATRIRRAINQRTLGELANARPTRIGLGYLLLETATGEVRLNCDRIIARIGTESRPWGSARTLELLAAAAVLLVAFAVIEVRLARAPLVPLVTNSLRSG